MFGKLGLSLLRNVSQIILNIKQQLINDNSSSIVLDSILLNDSVVSCGSIYRTYDVPNLSYISYLRFGIIKFNDNDNLDSTFGDYGITYVNYDDITTSETRESTGIVTTDMCDLIDHSHRQSMATCMCIQSIDGTDYILIGGHANIMYVSKYDGDNYPAPNISVFSIARYNLDGTLDTTFGSNGRVVKDIGAAGSSSDIFDGSGSPLLLFRSNYIRDIGVLSDGSIIVCGYISSDSHNTSSGGGSDDGVIAKFNQNGVFLSKNIITTTSTMSLNGLIIDTNTNIIYCCGESNNLVSGTSAASVFLIAFDDSLINISSFGSHSYTNSILNTTYNFTKNTRRQTNNTERTSAGISISIIQNKIIVSGHIGILSGHYGATGVPRTICTLEMYDMTGAFLSSLDMDYDYPGILGQSYYNFKTSTINKQTIYGDDKIILGYIGFGTVSGSSGNTVVTAARVNIVDNVLEIDNTFGNSRLALPIISLPIGTQSAFQKAINISSTNNNIIITGYSIQNSKLYHFMTRFEENGTQPP